MKLALEKYGINLPSFGKIGGILANEVLCVYYSGYWGRALVSPYAFVEGVQLSLCCSMFNVHVHVYMYIINAVTSFFPAVVYG